MKVILVFVFVLCSVSSVVAGSINVVSWGGAYTQSQVEAYHKPWADATGHTVVSKNYGGGLEEIRSQIENEEVMWDVIDVELADAVAGCNEGLFIEIDSSILPSAPDGTVASLDFIDGALGKCAVGNIVWSTLLAYDKTKFDIAPQTITDFFDIESFPGKRGVQRSPKHMLEIALMGDGVPASEVYEIMRTSKGIDRAFAKLDTIKDSVVWWDSGGQPPQLLADGEVTMSIVWNGRIFNAIALENKPFGLVWDGQVYGLNFFVIPKKSTKTELAKDFVKFSTDSQRLADQASWIPYGPARLSSISLVGHFHTNPSLKMAEHMPTSPAALKNALHSDFSFWESNQAELEKRFSAWLIE